MYNRETQELKAELARSDFITKVYIYIYIYFA